jgi:hypothetical protein
LCFTSLLGTSATKGGKIAECPAISLIFVHFAETKHYFKNLFRIKDQEHQGPCYTKSLKHLPIPMRKWEAKEVLSLCYIKGGSHLPLFSVSHTPSDSQHLCVRKNKDTEGEQKNRPWWSTANSKCSLKYLLPKARCTCLYIQQYRLRLLNLKKTKETISAIPTSIAFICSLFNI